VNATNQEKNILLKPWLGLTLWLAIFPGLSNAQPDDFFGTIDVDIDSNQTDKPFSLIGWVTQKVSYGLENPGPLFTRYENEFNKYETSLFTQLDARLSERSIFRFSGKIYHDEVYRINDDADYSADELNEFRNRFEVKDFYIEHQYNNGFYLKFGNQILAWGLSEYVRVTDLINTEDQYTFAQQDLQDLRLQVPAVLLSYSAGEWVFDGVLTYHAGRNDVAPIGDEFDQFIALRDLEMTLLREDPAKQGEFFFRASTHLAKGDIQFILGEYNDNALSVEQIDALMSIDPLVTYSQNRMRAVGFAANWVEGSWLYFGEMGLHLDKAVRPNRDSYFRQVDGWDEKDQFLSVLGVEYNGFRNLLLTFELDSIHTRDHDSFMQADEDQISFGARMYWTALNERLQLLAVWNELADNQGRVSRVSLNYNWSDNLDLGLLWVDYHSDDDSVFYEFRNNDVFQLQLKYSFQN